MVWDLGLNVGFNYENYQLQSIYGHTGQAGATNKQGCVIEFLTKRVWNVLCVPGCDTGSVLNCVLWSYFTLLRTDTTSHSGLAPVLMRSYLSCYETWRNERVPGIESCNTFIKAQARHVTAHNLSCTGDTTVWSSRFCIVSVVDQTLLSRGWCWHRLWINILQCIVNNSNNISVWIMSRRARLCPMTWCGASVEISSWHATLTPSRR